MQETEEGTVVLAASDVTDRLACAHLSAQRLAVLRGERARPRPDDDPYIELIRERGLDHEREQLALLEAELGPATDLSSGPQRSEQDLLDAAARTREAIASGAALIYQPTFYDGTWQGRADFLRRVDVGSDLGPYSYEVIDTKLARRVKPANVHQLLLYSRLLAAVQGLMPARAHVILGDGSSETIELASYAALGRRVAGRIEAALAAPTPETYPEPVAHCDICSLAAECHSRRRADDHLSLVARASRLRRERLVDIGLQTRLELAHSDPELDPLRLGEEALDLLRNQAALQVAAERTGDPTHRHLTPERERGYAALPAPSAGDVFFDLEGDPFLGEDGIEYLWGWWTAGGYERAWAHNAAEENEALEAFVDRVAELRSAHPGMHVFHYAPHERSKLRSLSVRYATREAEVDDLLRDGVLVDLFAVVRQALQVGEESYSLKRLERHHGYERQESSVREGGGSIVMYERWLELREDEMLEAIRAYNEDDCRSTESLRDWLVATMRPEAEAELNVDFEELAKPAPEEERTPPSWLAAVEDLSNRLLEGLPADASADDAEQARRRLLAHLVLYHHREGKPGWWRYFDLRAMSVDDLLWERDAIAEIERDRGVAAIDDGQSRLYTYAFPEQEYKLALGTVDDPVGGGGFDLVELEPGRLVLRRGKANPEPAPVALVAGSPYRDAVLREALVEVAAAVAAGTASDSAVLGLIDRVPPELPAELLSADPEDLIDACLALGSSVLPIQGPPGTGKTYRAARMIVGALASGLRVGMTAPSHAAIQNLLAEVEATARDWPYNFMGVYKGSGYESSTGMVEVVGDNSKVNDEHRLVAGTAWLFARSEHRARFDLLFVDEAGQHSLANTIAAGTCTRGIVLLGDPQQLPQVTQADHPYGSGASALEHVLAGASTIEPPGGVLLTETWRMHPDVCRWVSENSYDGKLHSRDTCTVRRVDSAGPVSGVGLRRIEVRHEGRSQYSPEEARAIGAACSELLADGVFTDEGGDERRLEPSDLMVVAPYNMAVNAIADEIPEGVRVGTVDRFQGQEAPVVFYALTCSAGEDVPRGLDFLFDRNRINVAISRAQALAVLVHSPRLLEASCPTLETMELLNGICTFAEAAEPINFTSHRGDIASGDS